MGAAGNRRKGAAAEREAARLLEDLLGIAVKRRYNLGTHEDIGDLIGFHDLTVQVASWGDIARAVRVKPIEAGQQAVNAGTPFAVTLLRLRGGDWRAVMTADQFAAMYREATQ